MVVSVTGIVPGAAPAGAEDGRTHGTSRFEEIGRVALDPGDSAITEAQVGNSGWLILNPGTRRGYNVYESGNSTVIRSFDLDSLKFRRSVRFSGVPIPAGQGAENGGQTIQSGDVVHAVDPVAGRIYIAMSALAVATTGGFGPDDQRLFSHVLVINEKEFDAGRNAFAAFSFVATQPRLQTYPLISLAVNRHHPAIDPDDPSDFGRLVAVFAGPYPITNVPLAGVPIPGAFDHTVTQWDVSGVQANQATAGFPATGTSVPDWERRLDPCVTAALSSTGGNGAISSFLKNLQWGILTTADGVYTGCQTSPQSGAVVRVAVGRDGLSLPGRDPVTSFSMAKPLADVMVDEGSQRLLLRSFGGGGTWWVFDAATQRYAGSVAGTQSDGEPMSAGVDPSSGRLWMLTDNNCVSRASGGTLAVRGGIRYADTRLDPVPAAEYVVPELAYPSWWAIKVDTVTRRVYVRRGVAIRPLHLEYPECAKQTPSPLERFYRVFEDRIPLSEPPADLDDSAFTTNVKEAPGITQASYLGSGQGYGARIVLTGGYDSLTEGNASKISPACGKDDREFLLASVGEAQVSDISVNVNAASFDADPRTQNDYTSPYGKCKHPQAPTPPQDSNNLDFPQDTDALDFDKNKDGINDYLTSCLDDDSFPTTSTREGFTSEVVCDPKSQLAQGTSTANSSIPGIITLAYSHSKVTVQKDLIQGGITVKVTSIARGIDIPGIGKIGTVQTEVTSRSAGRIATAQTTFKRTICGIDLLGKEPIPGCLSEQDQKGFQKTFNEQFSGKYGIAFRNPDPKLAKGSPSGYQAAVQRDRKELFQDQVISRDSSLAVPGLELIVYKDDGGGGARRQIYQFAGVQAATSYGIVCLYGQAGTGACNTDSFTSGYGDLTDGSGLEDYAPSDYDNEEVFASAPIDTSDPGLLTKVIRSIQRFGQRVGEGLLLALSSPMQGALVATVWALLYLPHYLAARRRLLPSVNP